MSNATIKMKSHNLPICRLAFGCEPLGGYNWGNVDIEAIEQAVNSALENCLENQAILFDTADTYGPHSSEERLGTLLSGKRDKAVLATKFGVRLDDGKAWYDTSPDYADKALDGSLRRLNTDVIDLYQLHWPDSVTPLQNSFAALERFIGEGRIKTYGVSNVAPSTLLSMAKDFPGLSSFSLSYSLIDRSQEAGIQALCDQGLTFIAYGCLAQGLLSGKYDSSTVFPENDRRRSEKYANFHGERLKRNLDIVEKLKKIAEHLELSPSTTALRFVQSQLPQAITLVGVKSSQQWKTNLQSVEAAIPQNFQDRLLNASSA